MKSVAISTSRYYTIYFRERYLCKTNTIATLSQTFSTNEAPFVEEEGGQTSASASIKVRGKANEPYPFGKAKMVA